MIDPGKLNKRITIYRIENVQNEMGEETRQRVAIRECWAQREYVYGMEINKEHTTVDMDDYKFTIRYTKTVIDKNCELALGDESFNITFIKEIGNREGFEIYTRKIVR